MPFEQAYAFTKPAEGGYVNNPKDKGGATNYGISLRFLQGIQQEEFPWFASMGVQLPANIETVKALTAKQAEAIYKEYFWNTIPSINALPPAIQLFLFDASVNHGKGNAVKMAQRAANTLVEVPLTVDGILGTKTRATLQNLLAQNRTTLIGAMVHERRTFFCNIVEKDPSQQVFLVGWMNRCKNLEKAMLAA